LVRARRLGFLSQLNRATQKKDESPLARSNAADASRTQAAAQRTATTARSTTTQQAQAYMRDQREPWLFASSVWTIANGAGGSCDQRFEGQALFRANGTQNAIVGALRSWS